MSFYWPEKFNSPSIWVYYNPLNNRLHGRIWESGRAGVGKSFWGVGCTFLADAIQSVLSENRRIRSPRSSVFNQLFLVQRTSRSEVLRLPFLQSMAKQFSQGVEPPEDDFSMIRVKSSNDRTDVVDMGDWGPLPETEAKVEPSKVEIKEVIINPMTKANVEPPPITKGSSHAWKPIYLYPVFGDRKTSSTHGVVTIMTAPKGRDFSYMTYGLSFCVPGDNFCKQTGRNIAWRRMVECGEHSGFVTYRGKINSELMKAQILANILNSVDNVPEWAHRLILENLLDSVQTASLWD